MDFLLQIGAMLFGLAIAAVAGKMFNDFTTRKFGLAVFSPLPLAVAGAAIFCMIAGYSWAASSVLLSGVAVGVGAAALLALAAFNVKRTSAAIGVTATAAQCLVGALLVFALGALALPAIFVAAAFMFGSGEPRVRREGAGDGHLTW